MNRMRGYALVVLAAMLLGPLLAASAAAQAPAAKVFYNVTFGSPTHTVGTVPVVGAGPVPRDTISGITSGGPLVVGSFFDLLDQPLEYADAGLGAGDSIIFRMDDFAPGEVPSQGIFILQSEIHIRSGNTDGLFVWIGPVGAQRIVGFIQNGNLLYRQPDLPFQAAGTYPLDQKFSFEARVDLAANSIELFVNGVSVSTASFGTGGFPATLQDLEVRFTTEVTNAVRPFSAAIDNVVISIIDTTPPPTSGLLYDVTFDTDKAGLPPSLHAPGVPATRLAPTALNGTPTVETAHGSLLGQPVVLDGTNDSVHLTMLDFPGGVIPDGLITLDADVFIGSGAASGAFNLFFFDESFARAVWLEIRADGSMTVFEGTSGNPGSFPLDVPVAVRVEINLAAETYRVLLDGTPILSRVFNTPRGGITQITANANSASSLAAAVDNVSVSIAPAPPPEIPSPLVYKVDFNLDAQAGLPATHPPFAPTPRTAIADHGGDPTVVGSFGALADQPLLFDGFGDEVQDFVLFSFDDLPEGSPTTGLFVYSADVLVESDPEPLVSEALQINLQGTSTALSIDFRNSGLFLVERVTGTLVETMDTGNFPLDSRLRLRMEVDRALASYKVILNGVLVSSGSLDAPEFLRSFAHIQPTSMRAAMDNVEISIGGTPSQFVECPANDTELARIFTDAGDGGKDAYILTFDPETSDGGQKDLAGSGLCPGPSFPGDGTDPTVGYIRPCPDNDCFGPEGRPAFGGLFHHRVRASGSVCTIQCYIIDGIRWCQEVCVQPSLGG